MRLNYRYSSEIRRQMQIFAKPITVNLGEWTSSSFLLWWTRCMLLHFWCITFCGRLWPCFRFTGGNVGAELQVLLTLRNAMSSLLQTGQHLTGWTANITILNVICCFPLLCSFLWLHLLACKRISDHVFFFFFLFKARCQQFGSVLFIS